MGSLILATVVTHFLFAYVHCEQVTGEVHFHYQCKTSTIEYDVTQLKISHAGYALAIAPKATSLDAVKTKGSCKQPFKDIASITPSNQNLPCQSPSTQHLVLYLEKKSLSDHKVIGGGSFLTFELKCDATDNEVFQMKQITMPPVVISPPTSTMVPDVIIMKIDKKGSGTGHIYIGDTLTVTIDFIVKGGQHTLELQSCTAKSDPTAPNPATLNLITGSSVVEADVFPPTTPAPSLFKPAAGQAIAFDILAFRFSTTNTVYVECSVRYCVTACKRRRRRATNQNTGTARASFTVYDETSKTSGQSISVPSLKITTSVIVLLIYSYWM